MAGDVQLIALSARKAAVLAKLLAAFEPIVDDLARANTVILGLRLADGSSRTVKLIATSLNDSAPPEQAGGTGGLPPGGDVGDIIVKQSSADGDADWAPPSGGVSYRELTSSISVAGEVPTGTEIDTALTAAYTTPDPDLVPADGDFIVLTVSSAPKFVARVTTATLTESGLFVRAFVVNSVTYYATLHQCGLY